MPATATTTYTREGGVGRIVIDRPPVNVLDLALMERLDQALADAAADPALRVLAITGAGKAFCAGVDVADHTADRVGRMLSLFHGLVRRLLSIEAPVVAVVHGATLGGGCELAIACDMVLAREDLKLGQPEIQLAVFPPVAAALLPRLVGRQRALDLILTGRLLGADEALALGLVNRVFPAAEFDAGVRTVLDDLAAKSGPALRLAKRAVTLGEPLPFGPALVEAEALYLGELMELPDAHEGLAAFVEKRPPTWRQPA